jgi:hypothetical protein
MPTIQLFAQFEGNRRIEIIEVDDNSTVRAILDAAIRAGLPEDCKEGALVFVHDGDSPLDLDAMLNAIGIRHKHRVHVHRCHKVEVTLHFNEIKEKHHFTPSATVELVKREFVKNIHMSSVDATEHVLQICGSTDRPEPDIHIGSLIHGCCSLCFDLVPIKRVEG